LPRVCHAQHRRAAWIPQNESNEAIGQRVTGVRLMGRAARAQR
jgi:hypothetical protein